MLPFADIFTASGKISQHKHTQKYMRERGNIERDLN
jgi:hypothetical protein